DRGAFDRFQCQPIELLVALDSICNDLEQERLIVLKRFVSRDVRTIELDEYGADVLVFPLDRALTPIGEARCELSPMSRFAEALTRQLHCKHMKIIGDNRLNLFAIPWITHPAPSLLQAQGCKSAMSRSAVVTSLEWAIIDDIGRASCREGG